ncbi:hypothetical protein SFUMM280S_01398 [Streptomyces fumanus]
MTQRLTQALRGYLGAAGDEVGPTDVRTGRVEAPVRGEEPSPSRRHQVLLDHPSAWPAFDHAAFLNHRELRRRLQLHADQATLMVRVPRLLAAAMADPGVVDILAGAPARRRPGGPARPHRPARR